MEFHISRSIREELDLDELLFSYTGNVVFANVAACRRLAAQLETLRLAGSDASTTDVVNAGALFAMGLIDELSHAIVQQFRREVDPDVLRDALGWMEAQSSPESVSELLLRFTGEFPNQAVLTGATTAAEWLAGETEGLPNREAALEELLLLWLANRNAAFQPFHALFDDQPLRETTAYEPLTEGWPAYFETRPALPEVGTLLEALRAPMLAAPDSLTGQLDFIRERWAKVLGEDVKRILLAVDTLRAEDIAIWMRFHPAGPDQYRHGAPGRGGEGFEGDEYVGLDREFAGEWVVGADGVRRFRRYDASYQAPLNEYEAFSQDQAWMPNVVLMAKSTYVWLEQLSKKYGRHIHRLDQIPEEELAILADRGMTALWLIGLWERSTASKTIKNLRGHSDAVASAYSLKNYEIAEDLGGTRAYECLRDQAARHGIRLASDMVPNHMGIDSTWVIEHPEWFISRPVSPFYAYSFNGPDLSSDSRVEIKIDDHYFDQTDAAVVFRLRHYADNTTRFVYHGNDGTTFAWNDTAQLDYSKAMVREQVMQTILHVARLFPIIRFDAAMTLAKRHVQRLWFPLPGVGGSIPSRAEDAISDEEFNALMPAEFWREVVDRVAVEVPGTLLLAEAFWLLEGYFVRTLGMHRVYNSAFMNMLRDEENAKYRSYLKKTIEFDPDIMKRYVNFMSNPDERTAIDQFGTGDKYFGTATMLATLPGLPMFAHGQIEGFTERYGMEFKQAKMDEQPNDGLVARHQREIAPLLKNRWLFAESTHFVLYDFWHEHGQVDENVFAYSNRSGAHSNGGQDARAVVLYNNSYGSTRGTIHISAASMDKGSGELRQRSISDGLALPNEPGQVIAYRDPVRDLFYLRRASDFHDRGLTVDLRGYGYMVLQDWRELRSTTEQPWDRLCDALHGAGVYNLDEALGKLRTRPLHEALRQAIGMEQVETFAAASHVPEGEHDQLPGNIGERLKTFLDRASEVHSQVRELVPGDHDAVPAGAARPYREMCEELTVESTRLPTLGLSFSSIWPPAVRAVLPSTAPGVRPECVWPPVLAWVVLSSLPGSLGSRADLFDRLQLRAAIAETFASLGLEGEHAWRAAAGVRVLLAHGEAPLGSMLASASFWQDADVRWLAGASEYQGTTYLNKERFEQMLSWLPLPALVSSSAMDAMETLREVEQLVGEALRAVAEGGYRLDALLRTAPPEAAAGGELPAGSTPGPDGKDLLAQGFSRTPAKKAAATKKTVGRVPAGAAKSASTRADAAKPASPAVLGKVASGKAQSLAAAAEMAVKTTVARKAVKPENNGKLPAVKAMAKGPAKKAAPRPSGKDTSEADGTRPD